MAPLSRGGPGPGRGPQRARRGRACCGLVTAAVAAAALGPAVYHEARTFTGASSPATASRTTDREGSLASCRRVRPRWNLRRAAAAESGTTGSASAKADGASPGAVPLWLDIRVSRMAQALGNIGVGQAQQPDARPDVKQSIKELLAGLREKFQSIGMLQPKGDLVDAILVEAEFTGDVQEQVKDLGIAVYTARRDMDGVKLPSGALFVCDATTQMPIGAFDAPPIKFSASKRLIAQDVWSIVPKEEPLPEEVAEQEAIMKRYKEGLDDDSKYVPPTWSRIRYLLGFPTDDDCLQVEKGKVLAKLLPPNPLIWARAIMQRRKDAGSEVPAYRLKSDTEATGPGS
uniref:Uncharacterized protein n=1 Tax=Alexandrium catenella TaxID=2925 RepID=A0A7S1R8F4_ALECA